MRFQVGDRVRAIRNIYGFEIKFLRGTIATISGNNIGVAFDSYVPGAHSLDGLCEYGLGLWVGEDDLELIGKSTPEPTLKKCNERETLTFATPEQIVEIVSKTETGSTFTINGLKAVVIERNNGLAWCISEPIRWNNESFDSFLAQYHSIMVDYDWSMEDFGDDNEVFAETVEKYGFKRDYGSYSDIVDIAPVLGCAAVNLSCGYYNAHTQHEFVSIPQMYAQVERAKKLIANECNNFFEWKELVYDRSWDSGNWCYGGWYDNYDYYDSKNKSKSKSKAKPVSKEVSLIPDDAYLQSSDGDWIDVGEEIDDFFVDDSGTVYVYDSEYLMVIPLFEYVAISANGVPCKMDPDNSFVVEVEG